MNRRLFAPILSAAAVGWAFLCLPVTVLEVWNEDRGCAARFRLGAGQGFSVTYQHSLYDQPVTEDFAAGPGDTLVLRGVRSRSGAVLQYFGFQDGRERQEVQRVMEAIVFRVATGAVQQLTVRDGQVSFLDFGGRGDRLTFRSATLPRGGWAIGSLGEAYRQASVRRSRSAP